MSQALKSSTSDCKQSATKRFIPSIWNVSECEEHSSSFVASQCTCSPSQRRAMRWKNAVISLPPISADDFTASRSREVTSSQYDSTPSRSDTAKVAGTLNSLSHCMIDRLHTRKPFVRKNVGGTSSWSLRDREGQATHLQQFVAVFWIVTQASTAL